VYTTARDLARFGLLYLHDGVWQGRRLLPEGWTRFVASAAPSRPPVEGEIGYGAQFWLLGRLPGVPPGTYTSMGNKGQYVTIVPERDLVIVRTGVDPNGTRFDLGGFVRDVVSALEMREQVYRLAASADLVIMAAAVCDFRPRSASPDKLKKRQGLSALELEPNPDILAGLAEAAPGAVRVGFAAETGALEVEARRKLAEKQAHYIVANDVSRAGIGFESDQNEVTIYPREGREVFLGRRSKRELAVELIRLFAGALSRVEPERAPVDR